jgi:small nuclear ribonucleoprotein (snRNP)-like protein
MSTGNTGTSSSLSTPPPPSSSRAYLESLLYTFLRIKITDQRTFVGQFICVDKQKNIILSCAEEFKPTGKDGTSIKGDEFVWRKGQGGGRELGMITIKGKDVVKIEVDDGGFELGSMGGLGGLI